MYIGKNHDLLRPHFQVKNVKPAPPTTRWRHSRDFSAQISSHDPPLGGDTSKDFSAQSQQPISDEDISAHLILPDRYIYACTSVNTLISFVALKNVTMPRNYEMTDDDTERIEDMASVIFKDRNSKSVRLNLYKCISANILFRKKDQKPIAQHFKTLGLPLDLQPSFVQLTQYTRFFDAIRFYLQGSVCVRASGKMIINFKEKRIMILRAAFDWNYRLAFNKNNKQYKKDHVSSVCAAARIKFALDRYEDFEVAIVLGGPLPGIDESDHCAFASFKKVNEGVYTSKYYEPNFDEDLPFIRTYNEIMTALNGTYEQEIDRYMYMDDNLHGECAGISCDGIMQWLACNENNHYVGANYMTMEPINYDLELYKGFYKQQEKVFKAARLNKSIVY